MNITLSIHNASSDFSYLKNIFSTILGIIITAYIGWQVYLKQTRNSRIMDNITDFNIIFSYVALNLEYIIPILKHVNKSIIEIIEFITNLKEMKKLMDIKTGVTQLNTPLFLPNNTVLDYIYNQLKNIEPKMILKESTMQIIGEIIINDYNKNSVFMTRFGNIYFHKFFLSLQNYYSKINNLIIIINKIINENSQGNYREQKINLFNTKNYENNINKEIQSLEFQIGIYRNLQECLEGAIFYTDLILIHLVQFNKLYSKKYKKIFNTLDIDFRELNISRNYDIKSFQYYKQNYNIYKEYAKTPKYHFCRSNPVKKYLIIKWKKLIHKIHKK